MNYEDIFKITTLIKKYITAEITAEQRRELEKWVDESPNNRRLFEKYTNGNLNLDFDLEKEQQIKEDTFIVLNRNIEQHERRIKRRRIVTICAAALIIPFVISIMLYSPLNEDSKLSVLNNSMNLALGIKNESLPDIYLITSSGNRIKIENQLTDEIKVEGDMANIGTIKSIPLTNSVENRIEMSRLKVPAGKYCTIILPDGSTVKLNSESELEFPNRFDTAERRIKLIGEAYLDVVKDNKRKFIVETEMGNVEVLGTSFNVKCYTEDGNIATTLVSGSVKFYNDTISAVIKPNEQCLWNNNRLKVTEVDVNNYISWTQGRYIFKEQRLENVAVVISRWYGIKVEFVNELTKNLIFNGSFKRKDSLSELIKMLEEAGSIKLELKNNVLQIK